MRVLIPSHAVACVTPSFDRFIRPRTVVDASVQNDARLVLEAVDDVHVEEWLRVEDLPKGEHQPMFKSGYGRLFVRGNSVYQCTMRCAYLAEF